MTLIFEKTAWLGIKSLAYTFKKSALLRYNLHENSPILRLQLEKFDKIQCVTATLMINSRDQQTAAH